MDKFGVVTVHIFTIIKFEIFKLIPNYRGFIVDTLTSLNYLDDQSITKDERLRHFNMKSYADLIKNESDVTITVSNLKNVYMPYELKVLMKISIYFNIIT